MLLLLELLLLLLHVFIHALRRGCEVPPYKYVVRYIQQKQQQLQQQQDLCLKKIFLTLNEKIFKR